MKKQNLFVRRFLSLMCVLLAISFCVSCGGEAAQTTNGQTDIVTDIKGSSAVTSENAAETDSQTKGNTDAESGTLPVEDNVIDSNGESTAPEEDPADSDEVTTENVVIVPSDNPNFSTKKLTLDDIPAYAGKLYITVSDGKPAFADLEISTQSYETYSPLDSLGRCGVAIACIGKDLMPTGNRGSISSIKPTGWNTLNGETIYNRSHLIAWSLTGENANKSNLITGTTYFNQTGMTVFENQVLDYIRETGNHVLYRVTPMFKGNELLARGVLMEAYSIEDDGEGICFNVFCYNVQTGVTIDYATGKYTLGKPDENNAKWILNEGSKRIHYPTCASVGQISDKNKGEYNGDYEDLVAQGYTTCGSCFGTSSSTQTTTTAKPTPPPVEDDDNDNTQQSGTQWILNKSSKKIHYPSCSGVTNMSEKNKEVFYGNYEELLSQGYKCCGTCFK